MKAPVWVKLGWGFLLTIMTMTSIIPIDFTSVQSTVRQLASQVLTKGLGLAQSFTLVAMTTGGTNYTYIGTKTMLKKEAVNTSAGLNQNYEFSLLCDVSQFNVLPISKQRVILNGVTYKIAEIDTDTINACTRLHLVSEYTRTG